MPKGSPSPLRILVVNDTKLIADTTAERCREFFPDCDVNVNYSGKEALARLGKKKPNVVLLDIMMPELDGLQVLRLIKKTRPEIKVIMLSGLDETDPKFEQCFNEGASDFIALPIEKHLVSFRARVRNALDHVLEERRSQERQQQLNEQQEQNILANLRLLLQLPKFRDYETSEHLERVRHLSSFFLENWFGGKAGVITPDLENYIHNFSEAIPIHDVGKVGIRDDVLKKPGKLTPSEEKHMRSHVAIGQRIIQTLPQHDVEGSVFQIAMKIISDHHERWDGSGYPAGKKGNEISFEGRVAAFLDVLDALLSKRHYKHAWTFDEVVAEFTKERGSHFDPEIVDFFLENLDSFQAEIERITLLVGEQNGGKSGTATDRDEAPDSTDGQRK